MTGNRNELEVQWSDCDILPQNIVDILGECTESEDNENVNGIEDSVCEEVEEDDEIDNIIMM